MSIQKGQLVIVFAALLAAGQGFATDLTEMDLVTKISETPAYQSQQTQNEGEMAQSEKIRAQFQPQLEGQTSYGESKEDPLFQFSPVITVSRSSSLGIAQKLPVGINAKIEGFSEQLNIPAFNVLRANRTGARLKFEMDLLSNFLGRRDGSEFKNSKLKLKVAELKTITTKNSLSQEMRKLYWSYMGVEESYKMAEVLLASAQKQLQEIKARKNSGAADVSDVARSEAQVAGRKTQLSVINYQKAQIFQQLQSQYDGINTVSYIPTSSAITDLSDCLDKIKKSNNYLANSDYSEMVGLLKEEKKHALVQARTTGDWDLKLQSTYQQNAVASGFSDSREVFFNQPKDAFQVGVQLTVPLGSALSKAEKHAVIQTEMGYDAKIRELEKLLHTQHERAITSLALLEGAVGTQDMSVKSLRTSVDSAKRKYSQARISQIEYILEQDKLFSTEVDTIQSRLQIINEVLDYLKVFNKQQCKFNKVIGA